MKKLTIKREVIKQLNEKELEKVGGGRPPTLGDGNTMSSMTHQAMSSRACPCPNGCSI